MAGNPYETTQYLNEYLFFHYGRPQDFCPFPFAPKAAMNFHRRIYEEFLKPIAVRHPPGNLARKTRPIRGLDIGCAVGRLTFELARVVDFALGIDNSKRFIQAARRLALNRSLKIRVLEEGDFCAPRRVKLPKEVSGKNVEFEVGDAQNLTGLARNPFHLVTAINLIDRLPSPATFLKQLSDLVLPGGRLVIGSPYTWLESYTARREWLGGRIKRGRPHRTTDVLKEILDPYFRRLRRRDLPFLIREHRRKYQWVVSEVTIFERRL